MAGAFWANRMKETAARETATEKCETDKEIERKSPPGPCAWNITLLESSTGTRNGMGVVRLRQLRAVSDSQPLVLRVHS